MAEIGTTKLVEGTPSLLICTLAPPSGKEYVIKAAFGRFVTDAGPLNCNWTLSYSGGAGITLVATTTSMAVNVWKSITTDFPDIAIDGLILDDKLSLIYTKDGGGNGTTRITALVVERPLHWDLVSLEHQYDPHGNSMPAGLQDMINLQLGYRSEVQRL